MNNRMSNKRSSLSRVANNKTIDEQDESSSHVSMHYIRLHCPEVVTARVNFSSKASHLHSANLGRIQNSNDLLRFKM